MTDRENAKHHQREAKTHAGTHLNAPPNADEPHRKDIHPKGYCQSQRGEHGFLGADWAAVIVNAVLAVVGIGTALIIYFQFKEMSTQTGILAAQLKAAHEDSISADIRSQEQLKALQDQATAARQSVAAIQRQMRQDQRAWLHVKSFRIPHVLPDEAPVIRVHVTNTGKTTAERIEAFAVMEIIKNGEQPKFLYRWYNSFTSGKIDNGDAFSIEAQLFRGDQPLTQPPQLIPAESFQTLITGRAFIVVYLLIKYRDIFDVKHWVKFCTWDSYAAGGIFTSKACADYNSVDNN